ncbi:MAG: hypothetical protein BGP09_10175 [Rhizobium sp. 60-20]|nr:MAG: hypothetical protein BGP09_10175 [Rhizobium sp. 60-20]
MGAGLTSSEVGPVLPRQGLVILPGAVLSIEKDQRTGGGGGLLPRVDVALSSQFLFLLIDIQYFLS